MRLPEARQTLWLLAHGSLFSETVVAFFAGYGKNATFVMNREVCYECPECDACMPTQSSTPVLDHYFYFTNVGDCGGTQTQNTGTAQAFIDSVSNSGFVCLMPPRPRPMAQDTTS